ncbi:MAG: hypothetical protein SV487_00185, partial [Thermodesulfobacteriota bacterium]|nr:hypothetical protein [Thermodesulfobacteriota bacterium]
GNGAVITAKSLVLSDVPPGRIRWGGQPVRKIEQVWKQAALAKRELPRLREFFRLFKKAGSFDELKAEFFKKAGPMKDSKDE